jgi:hypothetical protein
MTSEKAYDNSQRLDLLVPRVGAVESLVGTDSWHDTAGMANGWGKGTGYFKYTLIVPGLVGVAWDGLTLGTVADGTTILSAANGLPSGYRPAVGRKLCSTTDVIKVNGAAFEMASFEFESGGSVQCFGFGTAATYASGTGFYATGF